MPKNHLPKAEKWEIIQFNWHFLVLKIKKNHHKLQNPVSGGYSQVAKDILTKRIIFTQLCNYFSQKIIINIKDFLVEKIIFLKKV